MSMRERFTALLGAGEPDVQTTDNYRDSGFFGTLRSDDYDRRDADYIKDDLEKYWRHYETNPLIRVPINLYANDVTEPGYRVIADNDELQQRLEQWLEQGALVNGELDRNFSEILEECIVQQEVRGTATVEVVRNEEGGIWGFRMLNVSTLEALTYNGQNILIKPGEDNIDVPSNRVGEAAAYLQFSNSAIGGPFRGSDEVPLSQNDLVKLVRDGDTSDVFGTSRVEAVSQYVDGLNQILADNEEAIASKAYPHWIFKLGEPAGNDQDPRAGVWPDEEIKKLRDNHKADNYSAGQKDFLPGDVDVDTINGETADIEETINFYVEYILSSMPVPKYQLGFADSINRDITAEQEKRYKKQVSKERRNLEEAFRPVLRRKAREWGYTSSDVKLKIEPAASDNPLTSDEFDAGEFMSMAQGINNLAPNGATELIVTPEEIRTEFLGLPAEPEEASDQPLPELDEDHEEVKAAFDEMYDTSEAEEASPPAEETGETIEADD